MSTHLGCNQYGHAPGCGHVTQESGGITLTDPAGEWTAEQAREVDYAMSDLDAVWSEIHPSFDVDPIDQALIEAFVEGENSGDLARFVHRLRHIADHDVDRVMIGGGYYGDDENDDPYGSMHLTREDLDERYAETLKTAIRTAADRLEPYA